MKNKKAYLVLADGTVFKMCIRDRAIGVAPISPTNLINGIVEANKKGI